MKQFITLRRAAFGLAVAALLPLGAAAQTPGVALQGLPLESSASTDQSTESLDRIVAVVNNDVILQSELDATVDMIKKQRGQKLAERPRDELRSQVLDEMITRKLQIQAADRAGIKVSKADLQQGLARIAQQNHMSMEQFAHAVAASGLDMGILQQRVAEQIKIAKIRQRDVAQTVAVSDADVNNYLANASKHVDQDDPANDDGHKKVMVAEARLRHIILRPNELRNNTRTQQLARKIRERLLAGDDFATLARQYSDDKATSGQGGNVGWVPLERLAPNTRKLIAGLEQNQISRVFPTQDGYEIIELLGKRQQDRTQQAKRSHARRVLSNERAHEKGDLWLHQLRDEAYIDIRMRGYKPDTGKLNLRG